MHSTGKGAILCSLPSGLKKSIETRSFATEKRGQIFVIESGSTFVTGVFDLFECEGPVSEERWNGTRCWHKVPGTRPYPATYLWHLRAARRIEPVLASRRRGQVTWVTL